MDITVIETGRLIYRSVLLQGEMIYLRNNEIPFWEQYTLTIEEASKYFRIGENKLRRIVSENQDADFIFWNGNRIQIKRKLFEKYIDQCEAV